jgi:hypothetical protein
MLHCPELRLPDTLVYLRVAGSSRARTHKACCRLQRQRQLSGCQRSDAGYFDFWFSALINSWAVGPDEAGF